MNKKSDMDVTHNNPLAAQQAMVAWASEMVALGYKDTCPDVDRFVMAKGGRTMEMWVDDCTVHMLVKGAI
jgi:hypothetical protein